MSVKTNNAIKKGITKYNPYQLSVIPEGWDYILLGQYGEFINGLNKEKQDYGHGYYHVNIDNIFESFSINVKGLGKVNASNNEIKRYSLQRGDICLLRSSVKLEGVGYPALFDSDFHPVVFSGFIIRYRPDTSVWHSKFLVYMLRSYFVRKNVQGWATVSANTNINQESLKKIPVLKPPIAEQMTIASILSKLDEFIQITDKIIVETKKLKKGLMRRLLTKGIGHTKFKQTKVGEIPADWSIDEIQNHSKITTGAKNTQDRIEGGKYPFFVRSQKVERINTYSFDGEAVLTAGDGVGTGKVFHYINGKFDFHQRVYKISDFSNDLNGEFFYWYFSNHFFPRIISMSAKSSVDSVRMDMIAKMLIPLPPIREQHKITSMLSDVNSRIQNQDNQRSKLEVLKKGLMQKLLMGKIRVRH